MAKKRKKTTIIKRPKGDTSLDLMLERQRKRLKLKKLPREVSVSKLQPYWEDKDAKLLADKREDIKRRKKLGTRVKQFEALLKKELGRQIKVVMFLNDETDQLSMLTYFKPKKSQHSFDGDDAVKRAFKVSKLNEVMANLGGGTMLKTRKRDKYFVEIK